MPTRTLVFDALTIIVPRSPKTRMNRSISFCSRLALIVSFAVGLLFASGSLFAADPPADAKSPAVTAAAPEKDASSEADVEPPTRKLLFRAIDAGTEKPIAGMRLNVSVMFERARMTPGPFFTDEEGRATVEYIEGASYLHIRTVHDSYPPKYLSWEKARNDVIPVEYAYKVEAGEQAGGIVENEKGEAIADLELTIAVQDDSARDNTDRFDRRGHTERTNNEGKWSCAHIPKGANGKFSISVNHPDYIATTFVTDAPGNKFSGDRVSIADLRASKVRLVMKEGILVTGLVIDPEDKGVAGARVMLGQRWGNRPIPPQDTDLDGRFTFEHCAPGEMPLTITSDGFAPSSQTIKITPGMKELEVKVARGAILKGRVVDTKGNGISGARVNLQNFANNPNTQTVEWNSTTDEEGRFIWNGAPKESVMLGIYKQDFANLNGQQVTPGDQEHLFTLRKAPRVAIKVTDAETKQPIPEFKVTPGQQWGDAVSQVNWHFWQTKPGRNGEHAFTWTESERLAVKIDAPGYLPEIARPSPKEGEDVALSFALKKGVGLSGLVVFPDGKPAAGTELAIRGGGSSYLSLSQGRFGNHNQDSQIVTADGKGAFSFNPEAEAKRIYAVHDAGYAEVSVASFKTNEPIKLQQWGRVEGVLKIARKPAVNQSVMLTPGMGMGSEALQYDFQQFQAATDSDGRFVIAKVPPGERLLVRLVKTDENSWMHSMNTPVTVKPGETTTVAMGGTGRSVIGRVIAPGVTNQIDWKRSGFSQISTKWPQPPRNLRTPEEFAKWNESDEFKAAAAKHRSFPLEFAEDGTFRADDVVPGNYDLNINVMEPSEGQNRGMGRPMGSLTQPVVVADVKGDEPVDLGTLTLRVQRQAKVGEAAPGFAMKDYDGKEVKLADFKGRYLVLHIWTSAWAGATTNELAGLRALEESHRKSGRLSILSANLDEDAKAAKEITDARQMTWLHAMAGDASKSSLPMDYGLNMFPSIFVIGPDGKLLARDIPAEGVKAAVEKILSNPSNADPGKTQAAR